MAKQESAKKEAKREKAIQTAKPSQLLGGAVRHLQGINSNPDDVKLLGDKFKARLGHQIIGEGISLSRTIDAASTLEVPVYDPDGELRASKLLEAHYMLTLDGLEFVFVGLRREADQVTLVHEARPAFRLRQRTGAEKVYRGAWTRAEFLALLVSEVKRPKIPFFCPELHTKQKIAKGDEAEIKDDKEARDASDEVGVTKGKGLDTGADLTVKGVSASSTQIKNGDTVLRVGESCGAGRAGLASVIVTGIQEAGMLNVAGGLGTSDGYFQILDTTAPGLDKMDLAACANYYFKQGFTGTSALSAEKQGMSPAEISSAVEGNAAGASDRYQWENEAYKWVDAFQGGTLGGGGSTDTGGREVTTTKRYAFEREKNENTWECGLRLAEEVRWRWFEAAGIVYYIAEPDLLESKVRMRVSDHAPGVDSISYDWDVGRKVTEVSIEARGRNWAAPPGTVAVLSGEGPADGRYIVTSITSNLDSEAVSVTLERPTRPLPEPAPETETKTVGGSSGGGGDEAATEDSSNEAGVGSYDGKQVAKWIIPWLEKSKQAGWGGTVTSGYRTPEYSESICQGMCGAPSCPGTCAGTSSNHSGDHYPEGAVDVSDYTNFGSIQPKIGSPLKNDLPSDRVHFSVSGH